MQILNGLPHNFVLWGPGAAETTRDSLISISEETSAIS